MHPGSPVSHCATSRRARWASTARRCCALSPDWPQPSTAHLRRRWWETGASPMTMEPQAVEYERATRSNRQFATFFVDGLFFGIEVVQVKEVLRYQEMTPVPMAPDVVEGLINLRGQIVTAVDMRRRLALQPRPEGQMPMNTVVRTAGGAVSLLVDEIGDVVEVDADTFEHTPDNVCAAARELLTGVYKLKERLLLVLDTEKTVNVTVEQRSKDL